jgi:hypothetical protein
VPPKKRLHLSFPSPVLPHACACGVQQQSTPRSFAFFSQMTTDDLELTLLHHHHFHFCPLLEQWSLSSSRADRPQTSTVHSKFAPRRKCNQDRPAFHSLRQQQACRKMGTVARRKSPKSSNNSPKLLSNNAA